MFCANWKAILAPSIFRSVYILSQALNKNWSNVLGQHNLILTCWLVKYDPYMYSSILKLQKKKLLFHRNFENWILTGVFTLLHTKFSMTSLLTHNVAHSTGYSFRSKTNKQPLKKFLSLAFTWVKVVKNWTSFKKIKWFKNWSFQYRIVASRNTSRLVTPHVTNWIKLN